MNRFLLSALTAALLLPAVSSFGAGYSDGKLLAIDTKALHLDELLSVAGDGLSVSGGVFFVILGDGLQHTGGVVTILFGDGLAITGGVLTATVSGGGEALAETLTNGNNAAGLSATNFGNVQMASWQLGTNAPVTEFAIDPGFITNNQAGVTLDGTFSGDMSDGTNVAASNVVVAFTPTNYTSGGTGLLQHATGIDEALGNLAASFGELSIVDGASQVITDAAGFVEVNDWESNIVKAGFTGSSTGLLYSAAGEYLTIFDLSFTAADQVNVMVALYTNGVIATDSAGNTVQTRRDITSAGNYGGISLHRTLVIAADTFVSLRMDVSADTTITWEGAVLHGKKP